MSGIHNLKPEKVVKAFVRDGWSIVKTRKGSHVKLTKEGFRSILSIPVHKGKPIKYGLLKNQISKAGITIDKFLQLYK